MCETPVELLSLSKTKSVFARPALFRGVLHNRKKKHEEALFKSKPTVALLAAFGTCAPPPSSFFEGVGDTGAIFHTRANCVVALVIEESQG